MMWHTHAAIGASSTWLLLPFLPTDGTVNIAIERAFCVAGALVPDLDAAQSQIKHIKILGTRPFVPVANAVNRDFGHRGLWHSLRGWMIWTLLIVPLALWLGLMTVVALSLGYISHLAGDACTRTGIPLLYPSKRSMNLLASKMRVVTGSD